MRMFTLLNYGFQAPSIAHTNSANIVLRSNQHGHRL